MRPQQRCADGVPRLSSHLRMLLSSGLSRHWRCYPAVPRGTPGNRPGSRSRRLSGTAGRTRSRGTDARQASGPSASGAAPGGPRGGARARTARLSCWSMASASAKGSRVRPEVPRAGPPSPGSASGQACTRSKGVCGRSYTRRIRAPTRTLRTSLTDGRNRFWKSRRSCGRGRSGRPRPRGSRTGRTPRVSGRGSSSSARCARCRLSCRAAPG